MHLSVYQDLPFRSLFKCHLIWRVFPTGSRKKDTLPHYSLSFLLCLFIFLLIRYFHRQCVVICIFSVLLLEWKQRLWFIVLPSVICKEPGTWQILDYYFWINVQILGYSRQFLSKFWNTPWVPAVCEGLAEHFCIHWFHVFPLHSLIGRGPCFSCRLSIKR